ncbi:HD domain-containing protein [Bacillaceae bacterium S4-13-58]
MIQMELIAEVKESVRKRFENDSTGHDYWHMARVVHISEQIATKEGADVFQCQLAGWIHDLFDHKLCEHPEEEKNKMSNFLLGRGLSYEEVKKTMNIIEEVSFSKNKTPPTTIEGKVVQDADRLDAIGAIGIARTFAYGGAKGQLIYNPGSETQHIEGLHLQGSASTSIQHFYDKLLKLKDLMNTKYGYQLACERHQFMDGFLKQFYKEWPTNL